MVAPRAILAIHNTGIDHLGSQAASVSMRAAADVYEALRIPDRIGFSQTVARAHTAANTSVTKDSYQKELTPWVTWSTPELK